jgi:hypothetical protein
MLTRTILYADASSDRHALHAYTGTDLRALYCMLLLLCYISLTDTLIKRLPGWTMTECAAGARALRADAPQLCTLDADCTAVIGSVCDTTTATAGTHRCIVPDAGTCITNQHCAASVLGPKCRAGHCAQN